MVKKYAVINQKGGVGKTTTALNLAADLTRRKNRVLIVDFDPSGNLSSTAGVKGQTPNIFDACVGRDGVRADIHECIKKSPFGDIIPGSKLLNTWDLAVSNAGPGSSFRLKETLSPVLDDYKYLIVDTPPMLGGLSVNAMAAVDSIIIPVRADNYSVEGVQELYDSYSSVKQYCNPGLKIDGILLISDTPRTVISREIKISLDSIAKVFGTKFFKTCIRQNINITEANAKQMPIYKYLPSCNGAVDYKTWVSELLKG